MRRRGISPLILLSLPGLCGFIMFYLAPFALSFPLILDGQILSLLSNGPFRLALGNTGIFLLTCIPLNMILPLFLALLMNGLKKDLKNIFTALVLLPMVAPSTTVVSFWKSFFAPEGYLNGLTAPFGLPPLDWLNSSYALAAVTAVYLWKNISYNMILYMAGLSSIPGEYYEAADICGAGRFRKFRSITLVYLLPQLLMILLMSLVNSFKVFREIYLLCGSYPTDSLYLLQHFMNNMFYVLNYPRLAAASYVICLAAGTFIAVFFFAEGRFHKKVYGA